MRRKDEYSRLPEDKAGERRKDRGRGGERGRGREGERGETGQGRERVREWKPESDRGRERERVQGIISMHTFPAVFQLTAGHRGLLTKQALVGRGLPAVEIRVLKATDLR